jgi:hypothetical protein
LVRWRRPDYALALLWLGFGLSPTLAVGEYLSTLHSTAAQAPVMVLPAIGAVEGARLIRSRFGKRWRGAYVAACVLALVMIAAFTVRDYFVTWANSPDTRAAYFANLVAMVDHLDEGDHSGAVVISSPFPELPHEPLIADLRIQRDDLAIRWADGRHALPIPDDDASLLLVAPNAPLDPFFVERVDMELLERVDLQQGDVDPYFEVFSWRPALDLPSGPVDVGADEVALPLSFDGVLELTGYDVLGSDAAPGDVVTVATAWRVMDPSRLGPVQDDAYGLEAVLFVHAVGLDGDIVAQADRLDSPAWAWRSGDSFVQLHRLTLPDDLDAGSYRLALGMYRRAGSPPLAVLAGPGESTDRVYLPPVEVSER